MGWWGYDIMEGDTPLDCEGDILEFLADPELVASRDNDNWDEVYDAVHEAGYNALRVEANVLNAMIAISTDELCGYDSEIAMQTLGEMVMCSGGVFPVAVRCACIAAATEELGRSFDGWRHEGERAKCLRAYILRVNDYVNGVPFEPTSEGLFAKMTEHAQ